MRHFEFVNYDLSTKMVICDAVHGRCLFLACFWLLYLALLMALFMSLPKWPPCQLASLWLVDFMKGILIWCPRTLLVVVGFLLRFLWVLATSGFLSAWRLLGRWLLFMIPLQNCPDIKRSTLAKSCSHTQICHRPTWQCYCCVSTFLCCRSCSKSVFLSRPCRNERS